MSTIENVGSLLADNKPIQDGQNGASPIKNTLPVVAVDQFGNLQFVFENLIDDVYFPLVNIIFPYSTITDPFNNALFEYLSEDIEAFKQKLATFASFEHDKEPNFANASYEELLNTPVDEGQEEGNTITQQNTQNVVSSEERDLATTSSSSFSPISASPWTTHLLEPLTQIQSNGTSVSPLSSPFASFYINNTSNGSLHVPSSETVLKDPPEIIIGIPIIIGNLNTLVTAPFTLLGIMAIGDLPSERAPIKLFHGQIVFANERGEFNYQPSDATPHAETFKYYYADAQHNIHSATAYISAVQNENFYAPVSYNEDDQAISFSFSGNLLFGDVAAPFSTLSVSFVFNPSLGQAGLYMPELPIPTGGSITFESNIEAGAATTITVHADGNFQLTSTVLDPNNPEGFGTPFDINYIVDNGHGQNVVVSATITPNLTPVVLDLADVGFNLISPLESTLSLGQLTASNIASTVGWVGEGNGVLMYDPIGAGHLNNLNQISFISYLPGAQTDLQGLRAFDSNHNNMLDAQDAEFVKFGVLLNNGHFESLKELGISSISLISQSTNLKENGNTISGISSYQTVNGQTHLVGDVSFAIAPKSSAPTTLSLNDVIQDNQSVIPQANTTGSPSTPPPITATETPVSAPSSIIAVTTTTEHLTPQVTEPSHLV